MCVCVLSMSNDTTLSAAVSRAKSDALDTLNAGQTGVSVRARTHVWPG